MVCLFNFSFRLYLERIAQIEAKLAEVKAGRAPEYLNPLAQLQESMRIRTQVAGMFLSSHSTLFVWCFYLADVG